MEERFEQETQRLIRSWGRHDSHVLRDYLVQDVEDPRINVQSVLTRHWLIERLFGGLFAELKAQELRFAAVMNWLLRLLKQPGVRERHDEILCGLLDGEGLVDEIELPAYVRETFAALPAEADGVEVGDYVSDQLVLPPPHDPEAPPLGEPVLATFQVLWRDVLAAAGPAPAARVLECACGSANDYRALDAFGLAERLDYTGFDLCEKNVANAREMFPGVRFEVGNVLAIDAADGAFEACFAHDLFEHLSIEAMERGLGEVCRVTRVAAALHFFNMHAGCDHEPREVDEYHWNRLSLPRVRELLEARGARVEAVGVHDLLRTRLACEDTHNRNAWTLFLRF